MKRTNRPKLWTLKTILPPLKKPSTHSVLERRSSSLRANIQNTCLTQSLDERIEYWYQVFFIRPVEYLHATAECRNHVAGSSDTNLFDNPNSCSGALKENLAPFLKQKNET
jgi:hypothetical protein